MTEIIETGKSCRSRTEKSRVKKLNPLSSLFLLLLMSIVMLGGKTGGIHSYFRLFYSLLPLFLCILLKKWRASLIYVVLFGLAFAMEISLITSDNKIIMVFFSLFETLVGRFASSVLAAYYLINSATLGEIILSLERIHLPSQVLIPLAVVFRMIPAVKSEASAIDQAMKTRSINSFISPLNYVEYRIVPLLMCISRMGEDLSAAALCRGLKVGVDRSSIRESSFNLQDYLFFFICLTALTLQIFVLKRGRF